MEKTEPLSRFETLSSDGIYSEINAEWLSEVQSSWRDAGATLLGWEFRRARNRPTAPIYFLDGIELTRPIDSLILPRLSEGHRTQW
jgi:hypothetical protein